MNRACLLALLAVASAAGCGGGSGTHPSPLPPSVTAIAPSNGSAAGGTAIAITGANFASGMTVSLGGSPATNVVVASGSTLTALSGPHAEGAVDVVVAVGNQSATLPGAYTYNAAAPNLPPIINAIVAQDSRPKSPAQFADLGDAITVTATVTDAETPVAALDFAWAANAGTISGTGNVITWTAPLAFDAPGDVTITLTVTEHYTSTDQSGEPVPAENKVSATSIISLHDSEREVSGMSRQFLLDFSDSSLSPQFVMRNFTSSCPGTQEEFDQVVNNRATFKIVASKIGSPNTTIEFGGRCPISNVAGDACSAVSAQWTSKVLSDGTMRTDTGTDELTAVYEGNAWRLCDSTFDGSCTGAGCATALRTFMR